MNREKAIEVLKDFWSVYEVGTDIREAFETVIPELKESEDERIKNEIIAFVGQSIHRGGGTPIPEEQETKWIAWLEKQGSQNLANSEKTCKVEPKFRVGNWVTDGEEIGQIIKWNHPDCIGYKTNYGTEKAFYKEDISKWHRWTIEDAKDGDVLTTDCFIFIFKSIDNGNGVHYYCHYEICKHENYVQFGIALPQSLMGGVGNNISHYSPATEEQRDLLFQKMKEAGYEWDAEKKKLKKLKKVEQNHTWS